MKLLLDTHVWLDCALKPTKLGRRLRQRIEAPDTELWVSPVSAWEVLKLAEKGKFKTQGDPARWLDQVLAAFPVREASVSFKIARETAMFQLPHRDPADIWLAATARVLDLVLATRDANIIASGVVKTLNDT